MKRRSFFLLLGGVLLNGCTAQSGILSNGCAGQQGKTIYLTKEDKENILNNFAKRRIERAQKQAQEAGLVMDEQNIMAKQNFDAAVAKEREIIEGFLDKHGYILIDDGTS